MSPLGKLLQPNLVLNDCILGLTPELIRSHQLKGLVLDVDDTLVPFSASQASAEISQWVSQLRTEIDFWLVSNNLSQSRIQRIAESLDLPYVMGAGKPSRRKLRRAVLSMEHPIEQIAMVGDRLFTDVLAGNRLGMFTILVEPMVDPSQLSPRRCSLRHVEVKVSRVLGASLKLET